jgi:DNA-binding transcriptional LysR family regulator
MSVIEGPSRTSSGELMIENRHLRYFVVLAKTLHMRQAAAQLRISQPTLTQNMQQLEKELGTMLIHRSGRNLSLTDAGLAFQMKAELSLKRFEFAKTAARKAGQRPSGQVIVGFSSSAGLQFIPQLVKRSHAMFPDVGIQLRELGMEPQLAALRSGEINVAVAYAPRSDEFQSLELKPESLVIALHAQHSLAHQKAVSVGELTEETLIIPTRYAAATLADAIHAECSSTGFRPHSTQELSTYQSALGMVSAGLGVSIMPASVQVLHREGVAIRPIKSGRTEVRLSVLWRKTEVSTDVKHFLSLL